jgi:predicted Rossmann fold flavoprotein
MTEEISTPLDCDLLVAGGGAAGFFGAITCAQACPDARVIIVEKSRDVLGKVKISGGGRCNVTHACFDPRELVEHYPRGSRQLIGPMNRFGPADTMSWFEDHGVPLKIEDDNRVFPVSDSSQSIIDCLTDAAVEAGVEVRTETAIESVNENLEVTLSTGEQIRCRHVLLTLGGTRNHIGGDIATSFGHTLEPAAPSLFTFKIDDPRIADLQGLSVADARVRLVGGSQLEARGPVLVTHWGLSGPGILRLSAWGARELQQEDYRFKIEINWTGTLSSDEVRAHFDQLRIDSSRALVLKRPQFGIPSRLWQRLVNAAVIPDDQRWPHLSKKAALRLARELTECRLRVDGKSMNKEEFVTCGGVSLNEVDFKTMQSRITPGLHFAGEILDIDGITGGFNFQSAWTTAHIAGTAIADAIGTADQR